MTRGIWTESDDDQKHTDSWALVTAAAVVAAGANWGSLLLYYVNAEYNIFRRKVPLTSVYE